MSQNENGKLDVDLNLENREAAKIWENLKNEDKRRAKSHWLGYGRYPTRDEWLAIGQGSRARFDFLQRLVDRDLLSTPRDRTIIEWGPGGGSNAVGLSGICANYIGVDISESNLGECAKQLSAVPDAPKFYPVVIEGTPSRQLPATPLPQPDLFLSTAVFQHFPSKAYGKDVLKTLHAISAPRAAGFIQIRFDNGNPKFIPITNIRDYKDNYTTACSYSIDEFSDLARSCGFTVLAIKDIQSKTNYVTFFLEKAAD